MKRVAVWAFYGVGAIAVGYLALYAYAVFTGRDLQPGDPIHIFRKPDAPSFRDVMRYFNTYIRRDFYFAWGCFANFCPGPSNSPPERLEGC